MKTHFQEIPARLCISLMAVLGLLSATSTALASDVTRTAAATATVINGFVIAVTVTDGGAGYDDTRPPAVVITGSAGSGATAQATVAKGIVSKITVLSAGSGYDGTVNVAIAEPTHHASMVTVDLVPRLSILGPPGFTNEIQYVDALGETNLWQTLTNVVMTSSPFVFVDMGAPKGGKRFYRIAGGNATYENPDPANLVWIYPGMFTMGSPESEQDRSSEEGPQTKVTITKGFWMGKYEVTQGNYQEVLGSNPSFFTGDLQRPVEQASWYDATNYCGRLTERERQAGRLPPGHAFRLPTEAEWEYACRAGTTTRFFYGDDPDYTSLGQYAWFDDNSGGQTHAVGLKQPNPWGLYDIYGNVWEWCADWYGAYPGGELTDPLGPLSGTSWARRGGRWGDGGFRCRSAYRLSSGAGPSSHIGFRVVLASVPQ